MIPEQALYHRLPLEGVDLPGPIPEGVSHGVDYDDVNFTVVTYCVFGLDKKFKLNTRMRRMSESEIIHSKLRGHSPDSILKAYGVDLDKEKLVSKDLVVSLPKKKGGSFLREKFEKYKASLCSIGRSREQRM